MNRLLKHKHLKALPIIVAFFVALLLSAIVSLNFSANSKVYAAGCDPKTNVCTAGCYDGTKVVTCPAAGTYDTNGETLTADGCYSKSVDPADGSTSWIHVDCKNFPKPVPASANNPDNTNRPHCGGGNGVTPIYTAIGLGCTGNGNPIVDLLFAIIRLLGAGVGLVVIASVILAGIQYSASRGDPQASAAAMKRIQASVMALFIYIFAYAILNFVIPGGFFNG